MASRRTTQTKRTASSRPTRAPRRSAKPAKKKVMLAGKYKVILGAAVFAFAAYTMFSMISLQADLKDARALLEEKRAAVEQQSAENEQLLTLLESGSEQELIERAAREKLGYVYAGEEIFEDISGN